MNGIYFLLLLCTVYGISLAPVNGSNIDIIVGVIMNAVPFILDTFHFKPALDLAIDTINADIQMGKYLNFTLSYVYRVTDHTCGAPTMKAGAVAADMYRDHGVMAYFGPLCSPETTPVADMAVYWNIPVISGVSTAGYLDDKSRYKTLTRTSYKASNLADFMAEIFQRYGWRRCSIIWDESKSYWRTVMLPSLIIRFDSDGIEYHSFILNEYESLNDIMKAAIAEGRSKFYGLCDLYQFRSFSLFRKT